ncbi:MAG: MGMT family protein [Anaerolineaceae bacterium]|nr:MGMT family protein [Anaerolineaceae bacterium]
MKSVGQGTLHDRIFDMVEAIPLGKVATYGQIGKLVGGCSGRMVGFALASLRFAGGRKVPWQRVINRLGKISLTGPDAALQRALLEEEGVRFDVEDAVDLDDFGWKP